MVVTRAVGDELDGGLEAEDGEEFGGELEIGALGFSADIVGLSAAALLEDAPDGIDMVIDIEPVAHVFAIAVDGEGVVLERVLDEARDEFFGVLARAIVIAAVREGGRELVGVGIGADEMVGGGFGGSVRGVGAVGRGFGEEADGAEGAIDLVGGDVVEMDVRKCAHDFEEREGAFDVGFYKGVGGSDAAVDVALCSEMDDGVDLLLAADLLDEGAVIDVSMDEAVAGIARAVAEVIEIGGIGEEIEIDDALNIFA